MGKRGMIKKTVIPQSQKNKEVSPSTPQCSKSKREDEYVSIYNRSWAIVTVTMTFFFSLQETICRHAFALPIITKRFISAFKVVDSMALKIFVKLRDPIKMDLCGQN